MRLIGDRIIIRDLSLIDLDDFYEYGKSPNVGPNAGWKPFPNIDVAKKVLSGNILNKNVYAIALKNTHKLIGTISIYTNCLRPYKYANSIGFSLNENYWHQGYMSEAVNLIIKYLFTKTKCEIIEVGHYVDNYRSKGVIEKCGFIYDGRLSKFKVTFDGKLIDADFYSMTKEDYERKIKNERIKS